MSAGSRERKQPDRRTAHSPVNPCPILYEEEATCCQQIITNPILVNCVGLSESEKPSPLQPERLFKMRTAVSCSFAAAITRPGSCRKSDPMPMTNVLARPCDYAADIERVIALLLNYRTAANLHDTYPHPWRLRLLFSSRVWDAAQDSRIWEDANGRPATFAMLWRRRPTSPYLALERFVDPAGVTDDLVAATLQWATQRAQAIAQGLGEPLTLYASRLATAVHPNDQLKPSGFTPLPPDPDTQGLYLARPLADDIPAPALPPGYGIRPLQNSAELAAYGELFDFTAVNPHHRQEMFNSDEYGHLVAIANTGEFVAYCEYAFCRAEWAQSGRRRGWIEYLGVRPENRRQGLGRAALLAGLRQLQAAGAETALLGTMSSNRSAVNLYETTGFTRLESLETTAYQKSLSGAGYQQGSIQDE